MFDVGYIPTESYRMPLVCIPPSQSCHEYISGKSSEHDEEILVRLGYARATWEKYSDKHEDHTKSEKFPARIRNKAKFSPKCCLEIAHERTIDESKEGKKSSNKNPK